MFYEIKAKLIGWFGDIQIFKYPFFIIIGHTAYKIKGQHQRDIINILKPGDVLLRRYDSYISGLMIPGYFTHAAIYVGDNQTIHLVGSGICKEDILTFSRCDNIEVLRFKDQLTVYKAIEKAYEQFSKGIKHNHEQLSKGVKYDYDFDTHNSNRFYCTEFIDFCFNYPIRGIIDHKNILPDDFLLSDKFDVVYRRIKTVDKDY